MSLFNKLKNLFYEEEVDEEAKKEKKEEKVVKEEKIEEPKKEVKEVVSERQLFNNEPTFKFPIAFDDDFSQEKKEHTSINTIEKKYKMPEIPKKEEKAFRLTPIISPVYGVLDKNYKKEEIVSVKDGLLQNTTSEKETDIDMVRAKAYGNKTTREEKYLSNEINKDKEINLFENNEKVEEESYDLSEIDQKIKSIDELLKDTTDDDSLYSLVDNMYKDESEEDGGDVSDDVR